MNYPKATCDPGTVALRLANERADRWKQRHDALAARLASVEALVVEARMDNADLARQLTDASRRRGDAFDEGYDKAMSDAHSVLNQRGYLERRGDDNGNPYRALGSDAHTEQKEAGA